jgi:D-alanyl-D-alanine carboxypeptidase/D-alanyl-D-alanine-endopeptidase (penicillin-binding protein 4)
VFAKTGTISNVNALSGYLIGPDGRDIVFSILTNGTGLPSGDVRTAMDDILLAVARAVDAGGATVQLERAGGGQ